MKTVLSLCVCILLCVTGCSTMTATEKTSKRNELDAMATKAVEALKQKETDLQGKLDKSLAYGVASMKVTKVPVVGAGGGEGVLVIKQTQKRIYFTVSRFDIGGGWGARSYKALIVINDQKILDAWKDGKWVFEAGAEASAGSAAAQGSTGGDKGFTMHILAEAGASATATARVIRVKVNKDLTAGR